MNSTPIHRPLPPLWLWLCVAAPTSLQRPQARPACTRGPSRPLHDHRPGHGQAAGMAGAGGAGAACAPAPSARRGTLRQARAGAHRLGVCQMHGGMARLSGRRRPVDASARSWSTKKACGGARALSQPLCGAAPHGRERGACGEGRQRASGRSGRARSPASLHEQRATGRPSLAVDCGMFAAALPGAVIHACAMPPGAQLARLTQAQRPEGTPRTAHGAPGHSRGAGEGGGGEGAEGEERPAGQGALAGRPPPGTRRRRC